MKNKKVVITEQILLRGMSRNNGWSNRQMALLGVDRKRNPGWRCRLIGSMVSAGKVKAFIKLKDVHLKTNKRAKYLRHLEFKKNAVCTEKAREILRQFGKLTHWPVLNQKETALVMDYAGQKTFDRADMMFLMNMREKIARVGFLTID